MIRVFVTRVKGHFLYFSAYGEDLMSIEKLEKYFDKLTTSPKVHEAILYCENSNGDFTWSKSYGDKTLDTPMVAASITKLFTTTCILRLYQEGKLKLDDKITEYLAPACIKNLHSYKGIDYSQDLTINNLLHHTSGLPDFYLAGKNSIYNKVKTTDFSYSFQDEIAWTKSLQAIFPPSSGNKAFYADVNFDLLGKIIEAVTELSYQEACKKYIFEKLSLAKTFIASKETDEIPSLYYKSEKIKRNKFISSCYANGGAITTARELMIFLKAFWLGELFDKSLFDEISNSNKLQLSFYPICYAGGYMKIEASLPFSKKSILVGHSGSTGSFAFYCKDKDIFFVGDIPQISDPSLPVRFVMNAVSKF